MGCNGNRTCGPVPPIRLIAEVAGPLRVDARLEIPESELKWRFSRSGGPGGQHVNTSDSRVELSFDLLGSRTVPDFWKQRAQERLGERLVSGTVSVVVSESRSQWKNRLLAEQRLVELLRAAFAQPKPPRRPTKATKSSKRVRVEDKKRRGDVKRTRQRPSTDD